MTPECYIKRGLHDIVERKIKIKIITIKIGFLLDSTDIYKLP